MRKDIHISYEVYEDFDSLPPGDRTLLQRARDTTRHSYAPYSRFRVAAAARMLNGNVLTGTNQENAAYPAGICAERTLLSTASNLFPGMGIEALAITYHNENGKSEKPISPCGICRQSLLEFQNRTGQPIRLILGGESGPIYVLDDASQLLPLVFSADDMKQL